MNIYENLLKDVLEEEHNNIGVHAKFNIFEINEGLYDIAIKLQNRGWGEQEKSIDAMINVRQRLLSIMSINYSYIH